MQIAIEALWDGGAAAPHERCVLGLEVDAAAGTLCVEVDAAFHADPAPPGPPGSTPGLWNHEVVELFLFGENARYFELELGPFGHYLALVLDGPRRVAKGPLAIDFAPPTISGERWWGLARVPLAVLPNAVAHVNAHSVHGRAPDIARRYLSASKAPGARPDFHRRGAALPLEPELRERLKSARHNFLESDE